MDIRIGNGYDVHALAEGLPLWLGGVLVESPVGCIAHSDGDVAIHALCDEMALYDTGVQAEYGDQLLTLSTCDYGQDDARFVVVAKKIHN